MVMLRQIGVRMPDDLRKRIEALLEDRESIGEFMRRAAERECEEREKTCNRS